MLAALVKWVRFCRLGIWLPRFRPVEHNPHRAVLYPGQFAYRFAIVGCSEYNITGHRHIIDPFYIYLTKKAFFKELHLGPRLQRLPWTGLSKEGAGYSHEQGRPTEKHHQEEYRCAAPERTKRHRQGLAMTGREYSGSSMQGRAPSFLGKCNCLA